MAKKVDLTSWFEYNVDSINRIVYLGSVSNPENTEEGVNFQMSEVAIKALLSLDLAAPNGDKPITIIMNSPGGDVYHGLAIYDAIKSCKNDVNIICYGMVMSMAAIILQAATERIIAPNATFMIHEGYVGYFNHPKIVQNWVDYEKKVENRLSTVLLDKIQEKKPDFTMKKLKKLLQFDTILNAEETVELGLADKVLIVK